MAEFFIQDLARRLPVPTRGDRKADVRAMVPADNDRSPDACGSDRRQDRRELHLEPCVYEMVEASGCDTLMYEKGEAYTLNRSAEGVMLLMDHAPRTKQYLEVHTAGPLGRSETSVCEVAWIRPFQVESEVDYYMVGCHRVMGPCRYLQF